MAETSAPADTGSAVADPAFEKSKLDDKEQADSDAVDAAGVNAGKCVPRKHCNRLFQWAFEPTGPSGHSYFRKARFAMSLFSPFAIFTIVGNAKDIYLEKFGADPKVLGMLFTLLSFWSPITEFMHGNMQDRQLLARCFPVASWGRRAPWLLTHCTIAAIAAAAMYLPPIDQGSTAVSAWFLALVFFSYWGGSSSIISFEAARQELYPFKEERIIVEGLCKYACMAGGATGGLPVLVLMADASLRWRVTFLFYILPAGLLSLQAVPVLREARPEGAKRPSEEVAEASAREGEDLEDADTPVSSASPEASTEHGSPLSIFLEALPRCCPARASSDQVNARRGPNRALQHMILLKFWHGAYGATIGSMLMYYVTYVLRLKSWERTKVIVGAGVVAGVTETLMNITYMRIYGTGDGRTDKTGRSDQRLLWNVIFSRLVNAATTLVIIGLAEPSIGLFFLWSCTTRLSLCSFSFWRVSAQCWLVDEDVMNGVDGRRREGTIFGALSMVQNFAVAAFSAGTFLGLGLAGLRNENCEYKCADYTGTDDCQGLCFQEVINSQPEQLRRYIRTVVGIVAPLLELLLVFHAYSFPIKGMRLRRLYNRVSEHRGDLPAEGTNSASLQPVAFAASDTPHTAQSRIVLQANEADLLGQLFTLSRLAPTTELIGRWPGPKSLTVLFDLNQLPAPTPHERSRSGFSSPERKATPCRPDMEAVVAAALPSTGFGEAVLLGEATLLRGVPAAEGKEGGGRGEVGDPEKEKDEEEKRTVEQNPAEWCSPSSIGEGEEKVAHERRKEDTEKRTPGKGGGLGVDDAHGGDVGIGLSSVTVIDRDTPEEKLVHEDANDDVTVSTPCCTDAASPTLGSASRHTALPDTLTKL